MSRITRTTQPNGSVATGAARDFRPVPTAAPVTALVAALIAALAAAPIAAPAAAPIAAPAAAPIAAPAAAPIAAPAAALPLRGIAADDGVAAVATAPSGTPGTTDERAKPGPASGARASDVVANRGQNAADPFDGIDPNDKPATAVLAPDDVDSLLSWAIHLSRYAPGAEPPEVRLEPARFFAANACGGRPDKCRVLGWYADDGIVHIDERLDDLRSLFARSLVVHELVHYLQHRSGRFAEGSCESFVEREREAYAVQQGFFVAHGAMPAIQVHQFACPVRDEALALVTSPGL